MQHKNRANRESEVSHAKAFISEKFPNVYRGMLTPTPMELIKASFPLFGGEGEETAKPETKSDPVPSTAETTTTPGGSDPQKTEIDPVKFAELQTQVAQANKDLAEAQKTIKTYTEKEESAQRATKTKEENLEKDLATATQTIAQMEQIIRHTATVNAIQSLKDYEFQNINHVLFELKDDEYSVDVNLEKGEAVVSGIENAIKRIAEKETWLVKKKEAAPDPTKPTPTARPSGAPPARSAAGGGAKDAAKRAELIKKYPVIAGGIRR